MGIVLCHEVWGISQALREVAAVYESDECLVSIADFYAGRYTEDYERASAFRDRLTPFDIHCTLQCAIDEVRRKRATQIAVIGYSMGGAISLWAAGSMQIDFAVSYYAGGIARSYWPGMPAGKELALGLKAPWIGFYGGRDPLTPSAELRELAAAAGRSEVAGRVVVYGRADHGFALDKDDPRHDARATASASRIVREAIYSLGLT